MLSDKFPKIVFGNTFRMMAIVFNPSFRRLSFGFIIFDFIGD